MNKKLHKRIKKKLKLLIKKRTWIFFTVISISLIFLGFNLSKSKDQNNLTTLEVQRGDVMSTISASGNIEAVELKKLSFGSAGIIQKIEVKEGEKVKQGQVIALLDTTSQEAQLMAAQGQLQGSNANYSKIQNSLNPEIQEISKENADLDMAVAELSEEKTKQINQNTLDKTEIAIQIAEEQLELSEKQLDNLQNEKSKAISISRDNEDIQSALSDESENLAEGQTDLTDIQYKSRINNAESAMEIQELQNEQLNIDYDSTSANVDTSNKQAEVIKEKTQNAQELAQLQHEQILINKKYDLSSIYGQIMQAKSSIKSAEYIISQSTITAPFDSTILSIPFKEGEFYSGPSMGKTIDFADMTEFIIKAEINELDILKIFEGQKVIIELDANPDATFTGRVSKVNPAPIIDPGGVINYEVEISLPKNIEKVYHGLSVTIDIVIEDEISVPYLPSIAIESKADKKFVRVLDEKDNIVEKEIVTGLEGDINIEIISGLEIGDIVYY